MKQETSREFNDEKDNDNESSRRPNKPTFTRKPISSPNQATRLPPVKKNKTIVSGEPDVPAVTLQPQIDKLELVLPRQVMTDFELELAGQRINAFEQVRKVSSKSESYQLKYVLTCTSGVKVVFCLIAADERMRYGLKIILNPSHMKTKDDVLEFYHCLQQLFLPNWKGQMAAMLLQRADHAYDIHVPRAGLVIQQKGSPAESKFFLQSDRDGHIQTWYAGSIESRLHWAMYDQGASDEFKLAHGELPSRPKARDDAELVFAKSKIVGMTRFEARRVFSKPLTLREADVEKNPLGNFEVYLVDDQKLAAAPADFSLFLDSVRLRGVAGAGRQYLDQHPNREGKKRLAAFNAYLATCMAPWWKKSGLSSSIELALKDKQLWNVLKHLAH
jgi:hypothetical protein